MPGIADLNPFGNIAAGGMGGIATIILAVFMTFLIVLFVAMITFYFVAKKQYWINIHTFKIVGNSPVRVGTFKARPVAFGRAGDRLWRVAPRGFSMVFKILKWLPVGKYQTASNEFWYWIRNDGEWINFTIQDIDEICREAKVKFVQEDMRLQRLATERILEERLLQKSFWEKYGGMVMNMMYFLVMAVCIVIIFYQFSILFDKAAGIVQTAKDIYDATQPQSLIPAG